MTIQSIGISQVVLPPPTVTPKMGELENSKAVPAGSNAPPLSKRRLRKTRLVVQRSVRRRRKLLLRLRLLLSKLPRMPRIWMLMMPT
jgi:hypothetical protein